MKNNFLQSNVNIINCNWKYILSGILLISLNSLCQCNAVLDKMWFLVGCCLRNPPPENLPSCIEQRKDTPIHVFSLALPQGFLWHKCVMWHVYKYVMGISFHSLPPFYISKPPEDMKIGILIDVKEYLWRGTESCGRDGYYLWETAVWGISVCLAWLPSTDILMNYQLTRCLPSSFFLLTVQRIHKDVVTAIPSNSR